MTVEPRWSAARIAALIQSRREGAISDSRQAVTSPMPEAAAATQLQADSDGLLLHRLTRLDHQEFIESAYRILVGRPPDAGEYTRALTRLMEGDAKTWLLGEIRYSPEGRARGIAIAGLRHRYFAQKLFRLSAVGPVLEWVHAIWRLPRSLRFFRAVSQIAAGNVLNIEQTARALAVEHIESARAIRQARAGSPVDSGRSELWQQGMASEVEELKAELALIATRADVLRSRLDALGPPPLGDTLEVEGTPLLGPARARAAVPTDVPTSALSAHARYAVFEAAFYDSELVSAKQRIYVPYLDRELAAKRSFLDLGCGRGEFLRILSAEGLKATGVDINPTGIGALRAEGFEVVEQDLLEFLAGDRRTYSGASALQVIEHLRADEIERMLALVAARLPAGAPIIVETPNPLSPFALGQFHTDPTHVAPIPPERLRFAIEAAGFERTRTLFQARVPGAQFLGPDPRAYYMDYAIIAYRSPS